MIGQSELYIYLYAYIYKIIVMDVHERWVLLGIFKGKYSDKMQNS